MQFLGKSNTEIAKEKAGVIKPGIPVIIGETQVDTRDAFIEKAWDCNSEILFAEAIQSDCDVLAYIFMPDHYRILLQGKSDQADTLKALRSFKQKSGFLFSKNHHEIEWQKSFYDHILRTDEEIDKHMRYILENPVRKEIIEDWKEYPWKGASVYDLNEWYP